MDNVNLFQGDCLLKMRDIEDKSIDLTVTSPPYDNLRNYGGAIDGWSFETFQGIARELYRISKDGGVVVWVVGDATINGSETGSSFKQALYFIDIGFRLLDTMIWRKTNPMPQVRQPRYSQEFEYMFVFSKGKPNTFNPILVPTKCGGKTYNSTCKNIGGESGRTSKNFKINQTKVKGNIWDIAISQNKTGHPAVFPESLALDHILTWSNEGDIVLDPFLGSGTTGKMAVLNNRKFIGIELNEEYFKIAERRIKDEQSNLKLF